MTLDEVSNITVAPGQSLLLRCREQRNITHPEPDPRWEKDSKVLDARALQCSSNSDKMVSTLFT